MIPQKLNLTNFLSYQSMALDFSGLHIACICGANGAGKSSLLEAITWAIWGISRASSEDDIIYSGAKEAKVDFTFIAQEQVYRIIRTRPKGSAGSLEFQIKNDDLKITAVEIYNVMGEKIYASSKNAENNLTIDISNQPKGIYFVTVYEGTKMYNKKIVVQ